jgi:DNA-binding protein H-NS
MDFDLEKLTVPELTALIERANQEVQHRKVKAKDRLKQEIENKLTESGLDLTELFPEAGKKPKKSNKNGDTTPAPIKYRDPVSQGTWSGRGGRPPQWVTSIMMERRWTLDEFKASGEYEV